MNKPAFNKATIATHMKAILSYSESRLLHEAAEQSDDGLLFFRGLLIAIAISVPIWGVIIMALWSVL